MRRILTFLLFLLTLAGGVASCTSRPDPSVVKTLCLKIEQSYPEIEGEFSLPITEILTAVLSHMDVRVVNQDSPCDGTLSVALVGRSIGTYYAGAPSPKCYTGAEISAELALSVPGYKTLKTSADAYRGLDPVTIHCPDPTGAPLESAAREALLEGLVHIWGPSVLHACWKSRFFAMMPEWIETMVDEREARMEEIVPVVIQALQSPDPETRLSAIQTLEKLVFQGHDPSSNQPKLDPVASKAALENLPILIRLLEDENYEVSESACIILSWFGPDAREAIPALIRLSNHKVDDVRALAIRALGHIAVSDPEEEVVPVLLRALADEDLYVRRSAAYALGKLGPKAMAAVPALIQVLEEKEAGVEQEVLDALKAITGQDFGFDAAHWKQWWMQQR